MALVDSFARCTIFSHSDDMLGSSDETASDTSSIASDSTLDDDGVSSFGCPLERMPRYREADHGGHYDSDLELDKFLQIARPLSNYPSRSSSVLSFVSNTSNYDYIEHERVLDSLADIAPGQLDEAASERNMVHSCLLVGRHKDHEKLEHTPHFFIKRLRRGSPELGLLLDLNRAELREDPWNATPHILKSADSDDGHVHLCLQPLWEFDHPPLLSVAHFVDFFRQALEGLSFFHEHRIAGFNCSDPSSFMVDLCSSPDVGPCQTTPSKDHDDSSEPKDGASKDSDQSHHWFDRSVYPVRYYYVNFTNARRVSSLKRAPSRPSTPARDATAVEPPFIRDVQDCGALFDCLLDSVPHVLQKFKSLTKAMRGGEYGADDSRRLFEALCNSLDSRLFDAPVVPAT